MLSSTTVTAFHAELEKIAGFSDFIRRTLGGLKRVGVADARKAKSVANLAATKGEERLLQGREEQEPRRRRY